MRAVESWDDDVAAEELLEIRDRLLRCLALAEHRAVRGHHVPAGAARAERVRGDDLDARLQEVVPRPDVLRVALAHGEDDDRSRHEAVRRVAVPVGRDELRRDEVGDVRFEREVDDVGGSPAITARTWVSAPAYDCWNSTPRPAAVAWKAGMISANAAWGVEYATSASVVAARAEDVARVSDAVVPSRAVAATAIATRIDVEPHVLLPRFAYRDYRHWR